MAATLDMPSLGKFYRRQLLEDVLPFWFPRAYDEKTVVFTTVLTQTAHWWTPTNPSGPRAVWHGCC
ncbi:hypothetical protein M5E88_17785 [Akkermansia muciniphila]|nr:hypothetical protein M5E88_17785 [Akkermansia muciniphila]